MYDLRIQNELQEVAAMTDLRWPPGAGSFFKEFYLETRVDCNQTCITMK